MQPPDLSWNRPFKAKISEFYDQWLAAQPPDTNPNKPPAPEVYCQWIAKSWQEIPKQLIIDSFKYCGITIAIDGSEDEAVSCFHKLGLHDGLELLRREEDTPAHQSEIIQEDDYDEEDLANDLEDLEVIDDAEPPDVGAELKLFT